MNFKKHIQVVGHVAFYLPTKKGWACRQVGSEQQINAIVAKQW
jgi:hypothetical protein